MVFLTRKRRKMFENIDSSTPPSPPSKAHTSSVPAVAAWHSQDGSGWHRRYQTPTGTGRFSWGICPSVWACIRIGEDFVSQPSSVWAEGGAGGALRAVTEGWGCDELKLSSRRLWLYQLLLGDIVCFPRVNVLKGICWNMLQNSHNICAGSYANMEHILFATWALFKTLP